MRLSTGFWQTYKEVPADAEIPSHQLMIRAGLIHKSGAGLYNYLPFGLKAIQKVEGIIREELAKVGCWEILMTVVTPGELWQESGRWDSMQGQMLKFKDKGNRDLCISPTNEETVTDIFRKTIRSYKNLPVTLYQINTKFRDEIRPRFGLMRGREFTMKDAYSFHMDMDCLNKTYADLKMAYQRIFDRIGVGAVPVEADAGAMADGDNKTHEFHVLADSGEDTLIFTDSGSYAANIEKAETKRDDLASAAGGELLEVATPNTTSIKDVCDLLNCRASHSLKCLILKSVKGDDEEFILATLLGDDELNELKLKNYLGADHVLAASALEIKNLGLELGFIGPLKNLEGIKILFDNEIDVFGAYVVGAGKKDFHLKNFIPDRDAQTYEQASIRLSKGGDLAPTGEKVKIMRGIEVGHIFQLGDKYTKSMNVKVLDQNGREQAPLMGCYGLGVTRVVAAAVEKFHDEKGIVWPKAIAPAHLHLIVIAKDKEVLQLAEQLYQDLLSAGIEVVYDDRPKLGPGHKFKDAELLGLPLQLVLGERDYKQDGMLEIRWRATDKKQKVGLAESINLIKELLEKC